MTTKISTKQKNKFKQEWIKDFRLNGTLYLLVLPVIAFYLIFCYKPMYGALIAFKDYSPVLGVADSPWAGMKYFNQLFSSPDFLKILKNTLRISLTTLVFGFPAPIILALLLNEISCMRFKKIVQTASYMPHFISLVVICGMIKAFVGDTGFISSIVSLFTGERTNLLLNPDNFTAIYVISDIWQGLGWTSIIYLSALSAVDVAQYEAAEVDGAGRFTKMFRITLPSIMPTIITMLILRVGQVMSVGYEKIILLYNPTILSKADVITSYAYRVGFESQSWSYSTAVGLFNSVINFVLVIIANTMSKKFTESSLW